MSLTGPQPTGCLASQPGTFLASDVPSNDPRRFGIGDEFLGLSDKSPQLGLPISRQPKQSYLRQLKILISFLRGQLINHGTPPPLQPIRSNPVRPRTSIEV